MAEDAETKTNFFPEIGKVVDETAKQPESEVVETNATADDEDRAVQEIESLCMKCYKQVRPFHFAIT